MRQKRRITQNKTTKTFFFGTDAAFVPINETDFLLEANDSVRSREIKHMNHAWDCFGAV